MGSGGGEAPAGADAAVHEDAIASVIGDFGRWQLRVALLSSLCAVFTAWSTLSIAFLAPKVDHWCAKPDQGPHAGLTDAEWKQLAIPTAESEKGTVFSSCQMYDLSSLDLPEDERKRIRCSKWDFDKTDFGETITSKWELVCGKEWVISTSQAMFMVGKFLGCVVFGMFSDRFGRKTTLMVCAGMKLVFGVVAAFAPNLWVFVSLHVLVAMAASGMYTAAFVIVMEVIGMSWRSTIGIAFCFPFSIGYIMLAGMAWALRDWWKLQICISIPTVIFFGFYWILPESPRWLLSKGRVLQAEEILRKAKKENRMLDTKDVSIPGSPGGAATELLSVEQPTSKCILDPCHVLSNESVNETSVGGFTVTSNGNIVMDEKPPATGATMNGTHAPASADSDENGTPGEAGSGGEPRKHTALDLFRVSHMRKVMFNVFLCWFVNAFVYYGLSLNSANLGGNVFLNFALSGAIEIPAYALSIVVMLKFAGRRLLISVAMVSGGAACALIAFIPRGQFANDWPVTALSTVGKFGISASFALIYLFTAELIPTVVRNVGVGLSSTFARIGSILAPFLLLLGDKKTGDFTYPMVICGILSIVSGCLVWLLPETARQPMPDTFEQAKRQSQSSKKRASSSS